MPRKRIHGAWGLSLVLMACVSRCEAAPPDEPVGSWRVKCVSPDGKKRECVLAISREGKGLSGTCTSDGVTRAAKTVVFAQGVLSVRVDGAYVGQVYGLTYKGKPVGDTFHGMAHWSYGWASGNFAFRGQRMTEKVVAAP